MSACWGGGKGEGQEGHEEPHRPQGGSEWLQAVIGASTRTKTQYLLILRLLKQTSNASIIKQ